MTEEDEKVTVADITLYLNSRRTYSRNRLNLKRELENQSKTLQDLLNRNYEVKAFLEYEEKTYKDRLEAFKQKGTNMSSLGFALYFHHKLRPVIESQNKMKDDLGYIYCYQQYTHTGITKLVNEERIILNQKQRYLPRNASDEDINKGVEALLISMPEKLLITELDLEYLDYYKERMKISRCLFAGLEPYEELYDDMEKHYEFYKGVSDFMLSIIDSIKDSERVIKTHLSRWNI